MATEKVKASELSLGDVVRFWDNDGYGDATVKQVKDGEVVFFRPYVQTADFSYTGGVICYLGFEEFSRFPNDTVELVRKGRPLK